MRSLVLCVCLALVAGIYKDEAGKYDWALTHVGKVTFADYVLVKDRSRLIVQSERGVLASLKRNGQVEWRKLPYGLDADFQTQSAAGCKSHTDLITYAKALEVLAAWDPEDGMLLWSVSVANATEVVVKQSLLTAYICALTPTNLIVINLASGKTTHTVPLPEAYSRIVRLEKTESVALAAINSTLRVAVVGIDTGKVTAVLQGQLQSPQLLVSYSGVAAVQGQKAEYLADSVLKTKPWKGKVTHTQEVIRTVGVSDVAIDAAGEVVSLVTLETVSAFSRLGLIGEAVEKAIVAVLDKGTLTVWENWVRRTSEVDIREEGFEPEQFWVFRGNKDADYVLIRGKDDCLIFLDQGKQKWQREEALGHSLSATFINLPGETLHAHSEYFIALTERKGLAALPILFVTRVLSQVETLLARLRSEQSASLVMDNFGFNKLLVVTTSVGKVFALHSMTGETVWTKRMVGCKVLHTVAYDLEQLLLVTECDPGSSELLLINPLTGATLSEELLPRRVLKVLEVEKEDLKVLVIISEDLSVTLFPKGSVNEALVKKEFLVFYVVEQETGEARGYRIGESLTCYQIWSLQLPSSEHIVAFKAVSSGHIQQPAIATGLSKLLYKYLDSNLFVLATMRARSGRDAELGVYLVNGVTGKIISKLRQEGAAGRVSVDCDENWVVVHYWNARSGRHEFLSIELYEQKVRDSAWEMILSYLESSHTEVVSAYSRPAPIVLHQTYASTTGFQNIAHTVTLQGITRQDLLLVMNSGQVMSMDRRVLSPRRKPEDMLEESDFDDALLPAYKPLIPVLHTNILTHDRQVEGLREVAVSWTLLESTCFVAAYSLDLFVIRVMPEKSFDMLTSDFNYLAIVLSIGVLVAATLIAEVYFKKSRVRRQFLG